MITTIEAHLVILIATVANIVTTVVGVRSLRHRLNGHLEAHRRGEYGGEAGG